MISSRSTIPTSKKVLNRYPGNQFGKMIRPLLKSILKYAKDDSEIRFFSSMIESNSETPEVVAVNKGIHILRKNFLDFTSKGDHNFRKVKIRVADLIKYLSQILKNKCKNYDELGGLPIQTRIRDYIIDMQSSQSMEINGIEFLEIIAREAKLIAQETKTQKQSTQKKLEQAAYSPRPQPQTQADPKASTPAKAAARQTPTGDSGGSHSPAQFASKPQGLPTQSSPKSPPSAFQDSPAKQHTVAAPSNTAVLRNRGHPGQTRAATGQTIHRRGARRQIDQKAGHGRRRAVDQPLLPAGRSSLLVNRQRAL